MRKITYIAHHGIKGQQWGVKNGPPYPLSDKKHNDVTNNKKASNQTYSQEYIETLKKIGEGALLTTGILAAGYITKKYLDSDIEIKHLAKVGKNFVLNGGDRLMKSKFSIDTLKPGKTFDEIDKKLVETINGAQWYKGDPGRTNCMKCSMAYIADTICGESYKATLNKFGANSKIHDVFDNVKEIINDDTGNKNYSYNDAKKLFPKGSTGVFMVLDEPDKWFLHCLAYECDRFGNISVIDGQYGEVYSWDDYLKTYAASVQNRVYGIFDCSNATLKQNSPAIQKAFK